MTSNEEKNQRFDELSVGDSQSDFDYRNSSDNYLGDNDFDDGESVQNFSPGNVEQGQSSNEQSPAGHETVSPLLEVEEHKDSDNMNIANRDGTGNTREPRHQLDYVDYTHGPLTAETIRDWRLKKNKDIFRDHVNWFKEKCDIDLSICPEGRRRREGDIKEERRNKKNKDFFFFLRR